MEGQHRATRRRFSIRGGGGWGRGALVSADKDYACGCNLFEPYDQSQCVMYLDHVGFMYQP